MHVEGAAQVHPEGANDDQDDNGGSDPGRKSSQLLDSDAQRINVRGLDGPAGGRFRRLLDGPQRDDSDRLQPAHSQRADFRRRLLPTRQEQPAQLFEEASRERADAEQHLRRSRYEDGREASHPAHSAARIRRSAEQYVPRAHATPAAQEHETGQAGAKPHHKPQPIATGEHGDERWRDGDVEEGAQSSTAGDGRVEGLTPRAPRECG